MAQIKKSGERPALHIQCTTLTQHLNNTHTTLAQHSHRVLEPACFGAAPALGIFYPELASALGKREHSFGFFKTDYELSKIRSNTHSWAQRKLSLLSPLNILLTINGPLLS